MLQCHRLNLIFLLIIALNTFGFAQESKENHGSYSELLNTNFRDYSIVQLDADKIYNEITNEDFDQHLSFRMNDIVTIEIYKADLYASNYIVNTPQDVDSKAAYKKALPFRGYVAGDNSSDVRMTFGQDLIYGYTIQDGQAIFIEPLWYFDIKAPKNLFVVYNTEDVIDQGGTCAVNTMHSKTKQVTPPSQDRVMVDECIEVELAIASDFDMFQDYGSVAAVEARNVAVMNNVQGNYDDEFADELMFLIVEQFVSNCNSCDPWTSSTSPFALLDDFTDWGPNGFSETHDMGSLWTSRNFDGSTIGLAWVGTVCTNNRYHVLEDFSNTAWAIRVLTAHEMGHNFDADHDSGGSGFIMAPSVNNSNTWSNASINSIENHYESRNCLAFCASGVIPPETDFTSESTTACRLTQVQFTDESINEPTSWLWSFEGGTPATSTEQNPLVSWNFSGEYNVTLVATNSAGSDSETKANYMTIVNDPVASFTTITNGSTVTFINTSTDGDTYFWEFGDGNNSTEFSPIHNYGDGDFEATLSVTNACGTVSFSQPITISTLPQAQFSADIFEGCAPLVVQFDNFSSDNAVSFIWTFIGGTPSTSTDENPIVTYNEAGSFDVILRAITAAGFDEEIRTDFITVFDVPVPNFDYLVNDLTYSFNNLTENGTSYSWDFGDNTSSDEENPEHTYSGDGTFDVVLTATNDCGTEDIELQIVISNEPTAQFEANEVNACEGVTIDFTDLSNGAETWSWTFEGGTPSTSSEQNPSVTYNSNGIFDVELTVTNDAGTNTFQLDDYITIDALPEAGYDYTVDGWMVDFMNTSMDATSYYWSFGGENISLIENPEFTFGADGSYDVLLISTNGCGMDTMIQTIVLVTPPTSGFTAGSTSGCIPFEVQFNNESSDNSNNFAWTFEGGTPATSTDENPLIAYNTAGTFSVELIVSNDAGMDTMMMTELIVVGEEPTAGFSFGIDELEVTFTNTSTDADSYNWLFGDMGVSNDENPLHTYEAEGQYTVMLITTNGCGMDTMTQDINVSSLPTALFMGSSQSGCLPFDVDYQDVSTNNATSWLWTFEGGTPATSVEQNPTVTYDTPGTYDVTLVATNAAGSDEISSEDYFTGYAYPDAQFDPSVENLMVSFENNSVDADTYFWTFGNDSSSMQETPSVLYTEDGTYEVILVAYGPGGCTDTMTQNVTVMTSSLNTIGDNNNVLIYPNPNNGQFNVDIKGTYMGDVQLELYDILGRSFDLKQSYKGSNEHNVSFDVNDLARGTYVLKMNIGGYIIHEKIVVQ